MPVYSRKYLRQQLGKRWVGDTLTGTITASFGSSGSINIIDSRQANVAFSGQQMYARAWGKVIGHEQVRIATWNTGSGAWFSFQGTGTSGGIASGAEYEIHSLCSPDDKDVALNSTLEQVRIMREFPMWTIKDARQYVLSSNILDVFDAYYFHDPTSSLNREHLRLAHWKMRETMSGNELRIAPALDASQQIMMTALLSVTLGAADVATVDIPDEDWILAGAAARAFNILGAHAPGQEVKAYQERRADAARQFSRLSSRFRPSYNRKVELDTPFSPVLE